MTREKEVKQAAYSQYCNSESVCFTLMCDSFKQGAEWADANPKQGLVDLSQVWHSSEEKPKIGRQVLGIAYEGDAGSGTFECVAIDGIYIYDNLILDWDYVLRWAYIDDLLPKGGENENN